MLKVIIKRGLTWLFSLIDSNRLARYFYFVISSIARCLTPKKSLVFILELERRLFYLTGEESIRYGNGIHTKHRHTRYHDFFTNRLYRGEKVLDIGCGNGALSYDMAKVGAKITGIELNRDNYQKAVKNYSHPNLKIIHGDALFELPSGKFDTIVMSNVLEHIEKRVDFLKKIKDKFYPKKWLLRVPMYERDWRVPLMEELGVDYRLDLTHRIEYTREQFENELYEAGLKIAYAEIKWGEMWCEVVPELTRDRKLNTK